MKPGLKNSFNQLEENNYGYSITNSFEHYKENNNVIIIEMNFTRFLKKILCFEVLSLNLFVIFL